MERADANEIRHHVNKEYFEPIRGAKGVACVKLRTGDIHKELTYTNRLPAVCSALFAKKFEKEFNVKRISPSKRPKSGANVYFKFRVFP